MQYKGPLGKKLFEMLQYLFKLKTLEQKRGNFNSHICNLHKHQGRQRKVKQKER